jgi:SSS family solute:Na+ symporter
MNLDLLIVLVYLGVALAIGWLAGHGVESFREYALGDQKTPTSVITIAIVATMIGAGSSVGAAEKFYNAGFIFFFAALGTTSRDILVAWLVVPKLNRFAGCQSAGEIMAQLYGRPGQILAGLAGFASCAATLGLQVMALGYLSSYFLGVPHWLGVVAGAGVVVVYSSFGGMRSVTVTDIIQFQLGAFTVALLCIVALGRVGGWSGLMAQVPSELWTFAPDSQTCWRYYSMFFVFLFSFLDPALLQRLLINKDRHRVRVALFRAAALYIPHFAAMGILGLVAAVINPHLDPSLALPYLINTLLPVGAKGLAVAGIMAILMSTADSFLHMAGVMLTNDIVNPILQSKLTERAKLQVGRVATFLIGAISIVIALKISNMYQILIFSYACWTPAIAAPLMLGILGRRASVRAFLLSGVAGMGSYLAWNAWVYPLVPIEAVAPAFLMSGVMFLGVYALEKSYAQRTIAGTVMLNVETTR